MSERTFYERPETVRGHRFIRLKSGRLLSFAEALDAARSAQTDLGRAVSRSLKLAADDWDLEALEWFADDLQSHVAAIRAEVERRRGVRTREERIALLRNTAGRTPEEARAFRRKADELERRLRDA